MLAAAPLQAQYLKLFTQPLSNAEVQPNASLQEDEDATQAPAANSNTRPNSPTQIVTHVYPRPGSPRDKVMTATEAKIFIPPVLAPTSNMV